MYFESQQQHVLMSGYLGLYEDVHGTAEEPYNKYIRNLAKKGLAGHHGDVSAIGVPLTELPRWEYVHVMSMLES